MNAHALKNSLPRTWGAFFERYGNFTTAQAAAIPPLLMGNNVILCAPTASGKTEAALAPLVERYLPPVSPASQLTIVYLLPTRALINDLWVRLSALFDVLQVSLAVKTRDFDNFTPQSPTAVLLTTPESLDALLTSYPRVLNKVRAMVIDELHVFDSTVRGHQLQILLRRLQQIRTHAFKVGDALDEAVQFVALSATLAQPQIVAEHYFSDVQVVEVPNSRSMDIETIALETNAADALIAYLNTFRERGWRKALVFCNTRREVEQYATAVRVGQSIFGDAVYIHYSNLERERRHEIEQQFAQAETAICFASSTLELGIDIGNIDVTLLIGAPGSAESFTQRVGRANRRGQKTRAICFYRTALEKMMFEALPQTPMRNSTPFFIPSVAIQQIFSLLKQSPKAALRFEPLCSLFEGLLSRADIRTILGELQAKGYLKQSRMGEWRADERLNQLIDQQIYEQTPLSLYSNIRTEAGQIKVRDQNTQRMVAKIDRHWFHSDTFTLEGRPLNVTWYDGEALWVSSRKGISESTSLHYVSARQALGYELAQQLSRAAGLQPEIFPLLLSDEGWLCFHWLGDVYGYALLDLLRYTLAVEESKQMGLCLLLPDKHRALPIFTDEQVTRYLNDHYRRYEAMLSLGAYHHLLPTELRRRAVVQLFDVPRFVKSMGVHRLMNVSGALPGDLLSFLD